MTLYYMIKKIFLRFWLLRREFSKYFIIGISGVVLDMATLYFAKEFLNLRPVISVVINQILMIGYIFLLNKYWTFKSRGQTRKQLIRFFILASANYVFAIIWMWFWNEFFGFHYMIVRLANIAICVCWNFLLYKKWVYRPTSHNT